MDLTGRNTRRLDRSPEYFRRYPPISVPTTSGWYQLVPPVAANRDGHGDTKALGPQRRTKRRNFNVPGSQPAEEPANA